MVEFRGTVKELRKQLSDLAESEAHYSRLRQVAAVGAVASLTGAYLWRVMEWPGLIPARIALAVVLLVCSIVSIRYWRNPIEQPKLAQIAKFLTLLRSSVQGHGPLSLTANLLPPSDDQSASSQSEGEVSFFKFSVTDHTLRIQDWLTITAPIEQGEIQLKARRASYRETTQGQHSSRVRAMEADRLVVRFSSPDQDRLAKLREAIDAAPHHEVQSNELTAEGTLSTTLEEAPREIPTGGSATAVAGSALTYWLEWYMDALKAVA